MKIFYYPQLPLCKKCSPLISPEQSLQFQKECHPNSRDKNACKRCGTTKRLQLVNYENGFQCEKCNYVYSNQLDAELCEKYDFPSSKFVIDDVVDVIDRDGVGRHRIVVDILKVHDGSCVTYRYHTDGKLYLVDLFRKVIINPNPVENPPENWNPHIILIVLNEPIKVNKNGGKEYRLEQGVYDIRLVRKS